MIKNHPNFCTFLKNRIKEGNNHHLPVLQFIYPSPEVQIIRWNETSRGIAYFRDDGHPPFSYKSGTVSNWPHLCTPRERELLREESAGIMLDSQWDKARQHGCEIIEAAAMQNFGGPVSIV